MATITIDVPTALASRLVAALRAKYPVETEGLTNTNVGKLAVRLFLKQTLVEYETQLVLAEQVQQQQQAVKDAHDAAEIDGDTIT